MSEQREAFEKLWAEMENMFGASRSSKPLAEMIWQASVAMVYKDVRAANACELSAQGSNHAEIAGTKAALSSAPSAEPVAWMTPISRAVVLTHKKIPGVTLDDFDVPLYLAPPNLSAAVAAAREQDAEAVSEEWKVTKSSIEFVTGAQRRIRALQTEGGLAALREFGMRVLDATARRQREICMNGMFGDGTLRIDEAEAIVDRVLRGE